MSSGTKNKRASSIKLSLRKPLSLYRKQVLYFFFIEFGSYKRYLIIVKLIYSCKSLVCSNVSGKTKSNLLLKLTPSFIAEAIKLLLK